MIIRSIKQFLVSRRAAPLWEISLETGFPQEEVEAALATLIQRKKVISSVVKGSSFEQDDGCEEPGCGGGCSSCGPEMDFTPTPAYFPVYSWKVE